MVAGTLGLAARGRGRSTRARLAVGLVGTGAALALFAAAPAGAATLASAFLAGIFVAVLLVTTETALQEAIAPEARGRVFALRDMAARIAVLATAGLAGWTVSRGVPPRAAVIAAGALLGAAGLLGFLPGLGGKASASGPVRGD
jgi:MFS family permease